MTEHAEMASISCATLPEQHRAHRTAAARADDEEVGALLLRRSTRAPCRPSAVIPAWTSSGRRGATWVAGGGHGEPPSQPVAGGDDEPHLQTRFQLRARTPTL